MNILENYYKKVIKYDLINKFFYTDIKKLPRLKKIILNFKCSTVELKKLISALLTIEIITNQKGILITARKPNIFLKIKKAFISIRHFINLKTISKLYRASDGKRSIVERFIINFELLARVD